MIIDNSELTTITGGSLLNGTFINAVTKMVSTVLDIGRAVGSAIRRLTSGGKNWC